MQLPASVQFLLLFFSNLTRLEFGPAGTHLHTLLYHMSKWTYCNHNGNRTHRSIKSMHVATTSTWSPALSKKVWTFNFLQEHPHHIGRQFMAEAIRLSAGVSLFIFLGIGTAVLHWHRLTCRCWTWDKDNTIHVIKKNVDLKWFGELTGNTCQPRGIQGDSGRIVHKPPWNSKQLCYFLSLSLSLFFLFLSLSLSLPSPSPAVLYSSHIVGQISEHPLHSPSVSLVDYGSTEFYYVLFLKPEPAGLWFKRIAFGSAVGLSCPNHRQHVYSSKDGQACTLHFQWIHAGYLPQNCGYLLPNSNSNICDFF